MGTYKVKPNVQKYSCINLPACIQLASDWFKNNQVLSDSHMHNIVNLSLKKLQMPQRLPRRGWGGGELLDGEVSDWRVILQ